MYFGVFFMVRITFVEIRVKAFPWKCVEKASIYGQNHGAEQLPISERYWTLLTKEYLSGVI